MKKWVVMHHYQGRTSIPVTISGNSAQSPNHRGTYDTYHHLLAEHISGTVGTAVAAFCRYSLSSKSPCRGSYGLYCKRMYAAHMSIICMYYKVKLQVWIAWVSMMKHCVVYLLLIFTIISESFRDGMNDESINQSVNRVRVRSDLYRESSIHSRIQEPTQLLSNSNTQSNDAVWDLHCLKKPWARKHFSFRSFHITSLAPSEGVIRQQQKLNEYHSYEETNQPL